MTPERRPCTIREILRFHPGHGGGGQGMDLDAAYKKKTDAWRGADLVTAAAKSGQPDPEPHSPIDLTSL